MVILRELGVGQTKSAQTLQKADVKAGALDWKTWAFTIRQFAGLGMLYSFSVFLPTIINSLGGGWSNQVVQALTTPVYAAGALTYLTLAWFSDRIQQRGLFRICGFLVSMLSYIFLIANAGLALSFAGCLVVAFGLWTSTGSAMTWISVNNPRYGKRAFASGMQITIGNAAGVAAPFLFSAQHAPNNYPEYAGLIGMLAVGIGMYTTLHFWYRNMNRRKTAGKEVKELGEHIPRLVYDLAGHIRGRGSTCAEVKRS